MCIRDSVEVITQVAWMNGLHRAQGAHWHEDGCLNHTVIGAQFTHAGFALWIGMVEGEAHRGAKMRWSRARRSTVRHMTYVGAMSTSIRTLSSLLVSACCVFQLHAQKPKEAYCGELGRLKVGDVAPVFATKDHQGDSVVVPAAVPTGPVVFAGFGITARDMNYDDYASDIVKGAVVLVVDHEPGERDPASRFDGVVTSDVGGALRKAQAAQAHGAIGILYVSDVHNHPGGGANVTAGGAWPAQPSRLGTYSLETWMKSITIPAAQISAELAATLVKGSGRTLEDLSRSADTGKAITPVALPGAQVRPVSYTHLTLPTSDLV